jgi:hypothetical protein
MKVNIWNNFLKSSPEWRYVRSDFNSLVFFTLFSYKTVIFQITNSNRLLAVAIFVILCAWLFGNELRLKFYWRSFIRKNKQFKRRDDISTFKKDAIQKQKAINLILIVAVALIIGFTGNPEVVRDAAFCFTIFAIDCSLAMMAINTAICLLISALFTLVLGSVFITNYPLFNNIDSVLALVALLTGVIATIFGAPHLYKILSVKRIWLTRKIVSLIPLFG